MTAFPTREVREGRASFLVPDVAQPKGPGRRTSLPFYNPAMAVGRDLTVHTLAAGLPRSATILDGLAGTGVLGLRAALETDRDLRVIWNDKNPHATDLIRGNAARNGVSGEVLCEDLRTVLSRDRFAYVDLDPFGPPVPFVDAVLQQAWRGSVVGITATDTAPLAGTYPRACLRRYGARSLRSPCGPETALRIFIGYLVRVAASHERGLRVLLAVAAEHFVRAIVAVEPGVRAADECLAQLGYVGFDGARFEITDAPPPRAHAGPLWLGPMVDREVAKAPRVAEIGFAATEVLERLAVEADLPPFHYANHSLAQTLGVADPVPIVEFLNALRAAGHRASRTYFTANGVRTDAPWEDVARVYREVAAKR